MRFIHKLYAFFNGYFWLSCCRCGRNYGGHEIGKNPVFLQYDDHNGSSVCRRCTKELKKKYPNVTSFDFSGKPYIYK